MRADCHMHMILDGASWRAAIRRHDPVPDDAFIHSTLKTYQQKGYTWLRDGGDRWGAGKRARELAQQYGITYRTPYAPLCKKGCYGGFIGTEYADSREYASLVRQIRDTGGDFIKIMISGLMDFDRFGVLTQPGYPAQEIAQLVHIAHEEGMSVMAHANGTRTVEAAAAAGVDSVEHGAYLDTQALHAMRENGTVWVPTLSTIGNLRGKGRFCEAAVEQILESALTNVAAFHAMDGMIAPGTDAGAWAVPHGSQTEEALLALAGVEDTALQQGIQVLMDKF